MQLFALVFNGLVRTAAADSYAETQSRRDILARQRVSDALRREYQRRYAQLVDNVLPLLRVLQSSQPVTEDVQRRARAESRRLRALFDQSTMFDHPLMRCVRPLVDNAERRHIDVSIDMSGELPELRPDGTDVVVQPLSHILAANASSVRLVVTGNAEESTVSAVCGNMTDPDELIERLQDHPGVQILRSDPLVWFLIRYPSQHSA